MGLSKFKAISNVVIGLPYLRHLSPLIITVLPKSFEPLNNYGGMNMSWSCHNMVMWHDMWKGFAQMKCAAWCGFVMYRDVPRRAYLKSFPAVYLTPRNNNCMFEAPSYTYSCTTQGSNTLRLGAGFVASGVRTQQSCFTSHSSPSRKPQPCEPPQWMQNSLQLGCQLDDIMGHCKEGHLWSASQVGHFVFPWWFVALVLGCSFIDLRGSELGVAVSRCETSKAEWLVGLNSWFMRQ